MILNFKYNPPPQGVSESVILDSFLLVMSSSLHDCLILGTPEKHLWTWNLQTGLSKADFGKIY